jgi:DNA-binding beta-propeller fold protein YncE
LLLLAGLLGTAAPGSALSLASGDVLVADAGSGGGSVVQVDPTTGAQTLVASGLGDLRGIATAAGGVIYVATGTSVIAISSSDGSASVLNASFGDLEGIAVDAGGLIHVVEDSGSAAAVYSVSPGDGTATLVFSGSVSGFLTDPTDITLDATGTIYVTDLSSASVVEINAGVGSLLASDVNLLEPFGIALDGSDLVVADGGFGTPALISLPAASGTPQSVVATDGLLSLPVGVEVGSLLVADAGLGGVIRIGGAGCPVTPVGDQCELSSGGLLSAAGVVDLAVFVPEPATPGLLCLGLAALGLRRRRRGRQKAA